MMRTYLKNWTIWIVIRSIWWISANFATETLRSWKVSIDIIAVNATDQSVNNAQIASVDWLKMMRHNIVFVTFAILNSQTPSLNRISWQFSKLKRSKWRCIWLSCNILINKKILKSKKIKQIRRNSKTSCSVSLRRKRNLMKKSRSLRSALEPWQRLELSSFGSWVRRSACWKTRRRNAMS